MTTQAFRDAAYPEAGSTDVVLLLLLEHDDLDAPIRLTNAAGTEDTTSGSWIVTALGETWLAAAIEVDLPSVSDQAPRARLVIPNVDQRIGEAIDGISTPATVTIWAVLDSDPDTIVGGPHGHLILRDVRVDAMTVEGSLERADLSRETWPRQWIRPGRYLAAMRSIGR
ncbi:DUF1833 family protein [Pinisolibacter sp.]|uniref:DUF1833 family protein n=1 Tax=Pinisolibacter sp. TaxID=2172024 RepID=UPI002FDD7092